MQRVAGFVFWTPSTLALARFFDLKARSGSARHTSSPKFTEDFIEEHTMRETIRFAWGRCALGDFVVAMSDKGLVAVEFSQHRAAVEDALYARFHDASVVSSQTELVDVVERVRHALEDPQLDPGIPLDMRGTPYQIQVWTLLRALPVGETTSYGALAARLGTRDAREVTEAIASNPIAVLVPCHRVIKKDGSISGYRWGVKLKRELLAREQHSTNMPESKQGDE